MKNLFNELKNLVLTFLMSALAMTLINFIFSGMLALIMQKNLFNIVGSPAMVIITVLGFLMMLFASLLNVDLRK